MRKKTNIMGRIMSDHGMHDTDDRISSKQQ